MSFKKIIIRKPEPIVKPLKTVELKTKAPVTIYYKPNDKQVTRVPVSIPFDGTVKWDKPCKREDVDWNNLLGRGYVCAVWPFNPFGENTFYLYLSDKQPQPLFAPRKVVLLNEDWSLKLGANGLAIWDTIGKERLHVVGTVWGKAF